MPWTGVSMATYKANPYGPGGANYDPSGRYGVPGQMQVPQQQQQSPYGNMGMNYGFDPSWAMGGMMGSLPQTGRRVPRPPSSGPKLNQPKTSTTPAVGATTTANAGNQLSPEGISQMAQSLRSFTPASAQMFNLPSVSQRAAGELQTLYDDVRRASAYQNAGAFERQATDQLQPLLAGQAQGGLDRANLLATLNGQQYQQQMFNNQLVSQLLRGLFG